MEKITKRQKQLLEIIYNYIETTGYPPTFEEMRESLDVVSNQSVIDLLTKLEKQKFLKRSEASARSLTILPFGYKMMNKPPLIALLGTASAGFPIESIEVEGKWESVPAVVGDKLEKLKDNVFLLKISGDSMINAGIDDGSIVLVKEQKEFISGDIVYAQIGDSATVKRFVSDNKPPFLYLKPENPNYNIIHFTEDMTLRGKVISILKNGYWVPIK
ncbi:MAG: repressor LexA [Candidatus Staskawiczbacteria bacterium]|nr:repressor LexA [Candidatus Staskawiczbacteria bacterium]